MLAKLCSELTLCVSMRVLYCTMSTLIFQHFTAWRHQQNLCAGETGEERNQLESDQWILMQPKVLLIDPMHSLNYVKFNKYGYLLF